MLPSWSPSRRGVLQASVPTSGLPEALGEEEDASPPPTALVRCLRRRFLSAVFVSGAPPPPPPPSCNLSRLYLCSNWSVCSFRFRLQKEIESFSISISMLPPEARGTQVAVCLGLPAIPGTSVFRGDQRLVPGGRQPDRSMGKPSVKGLSTSNRRSTLAMLGEDESALQRDWLSNLPDELLLNIVERLDVADATRTSILSRRWKEIPTMLSKILIMVGSADNLQERTCDIARANATVIGAARSLLKSRRTSPYTIHRLCMQFFLGDGSTKIGRTVAKTIRTRKVAFSEFTILTEKERGRCSSDDMIDNAAQLRLFVMTCPKAFLYLARLKLENLRLGETGLPKFIRVCKRLVFLRLDNCDMGDRSLLRVEHPRLRELEIVRCRFERVDLNRLPELTKLTFSDWPSLHDPLSFGYVPLLHTVSMSNKALSWHKMLKFSEFLGEATVSNLHLGFKSEKIWVEPEGPRELSQVFNKLRLVNLAAISEECDLTWTLFVLQGAPSLEELCIRVCDCLGIWDLEERKKFVYIEERKDADAKWKASDFKHRRLSVLRIFGFQSKVKFLDYITTVMKASVNLEDIYLHEKPACEDKCAYIREQGDRFPKSMKQKILVRNSLNMHMRPLLRLHFRF